MGFLAVTILTGLSSAASLFLVAAGLSIIFGVTRIVNFAHGSLYMLGSYIGYSFASRVGGSYLGFWGSIILAAVCVGLVGIAMEVLILRRIYKAPELFQLVATFGIVLIVQDAVVYLWGPLDLLGPQAPGLEGSISIGGDLMPKYQLALIVIGAGVMAGLWWLFRASRWGLQVRAATADRDMLGALGVDQSRLFTSVFFLGAALAGLAGALQLPFSAVTHRADINIIAQAFVVVVVGGMGSIVGAFLAAIIIGELNAFGILIYPQITLVLLFAIMAVVLMIRPWGLLGKPEASPAPESGDIGRERGGGGWPYALLAAAAILLAVALPFIAPEYVTILARDILIMALFAGSLHFFMHNGGMVSFGHAAYFGLGAYGAALASTYFGFAMFPSIGLGIVMALLGGLIFGWLCVRLTGVYLAMLSLAFAQIAWSMTFLFANITGGENGLVGIWPPDWASGTTIFYFICLAVCALGLGIMRYLTWSPFGRVLRAGRDSPLRVEAIGIDLRTQRWLALAIGGAFAGVAGGLFSFAHGSVFPTEIGIGRSVDALMIVLLGGVAWLDGPIVGAITFMGLQDQVSKLPYWQTILGLLIIGICMIAPGGIVGAVRSYTIDRVRRAPIAE
jgi:branched-chain amino acid transport system permease protein